MRWVCAVCLAGCVYVGRQDFEDRRELIDEDGDGVPYADDCNDRNALQSPDLAEIPYDGIDNDCAGDGDLIDADGDGYPGVLEEDYDGTVYPEVFRDLPLDCADDPSEFPFAALISPAPDNPDVPYDGLDGGCDRSNDFDADDDGFMPAHVRVDGERIDVRVAFAAYLDRWGISGEEAQGFLAPGNGLDDPAAFSDCDDTDPALFPGNGLVDVLYDGIDENCDGVNEYDADGDGFVPPRFEADFQAYLDRHFAGGPPSFAMPSQNLFGDCLDEPHPDFPDLDPADVRPSVPGNPVLDEPYDGIDRDCARDNDFDADGDGFVPVGLEDADWLAYVANWDITDEERRAWAAPNPDARLVEPPGRGDCNDDDALIWPGALETFAEGVDRDCNGVAGAGTLVFGQTAPGAPASGFGFEGASNPELGRLADTYLVFVAANEGLLEEGTPLGAIGVAIPIPVPATAQRYQAPTQAVYPLFKRTPQAVNPQLDIAYDPVFVDVDSDGLDDPSIGVGFADDDPLVDNTALTLSYVRWLTATGTWGVPQNQPVRDLETRYEPTDLEVGFDAAGNPYAFTCGPDGALHSLRDVGVPAGSQFVAVPGRVCFVDGPAEPSGDVPVQVCAMGACTPYVLDDGGAWTAEPPAVLEAVELADDDDGVLAKVVGGLATVEAFGSGPVAVFAELAGPVRQLDAHVHGGVLYAVGVVLDDVGVPGLWLERHGGTVDLVQLPLDVPQLANRIVDGVAVYADGDRVGVAIRAGGGDASNVIGWVFMNP